MILGAWPKKVKNKCCIWGHAMTPENTYKAPRGHIYVDKCRVCRDTKKQRRKEKDE